MEGIFAHNDFSNRSIFVVVAFLSEILNIRNNIYIYDITHFFV